MMVAFVRQWIKSSIFWFLVVFALHFLVFNYPANDQLLVGWMKEYAFRDLFMFFYRTVGVSGIHASYATIGTAILLTGIAIALITSVYKVIFSAQSLEVSRLAKIKHPLRSEFGKGMLGHYYLVGVFPSLVLAFFLWIFLMGVIFVTTKSISEGVIVVSGVVSALLMLVVKPLRKANKHRNITRSWAAKSWQGLTNAFDSIDYYNYNTMGGVAVDVENKKLALLNFEQQHKHKTPSLKNAPMPVVCGLDKVISITATSPDLSLQETRFYGARASTTDVLKAASEDERANHLSRVRHGKSSGLLIQLDDIDCPEILVVMSIEHAKAWLRVLEKLRDGTLDKVSEMRLYPGTA